MASIKAAIRRWLGVTSDSYYPHRFVSMIHYRDSILAVDGNGDIYEMRMEWDGLPVVQLLSKNPIGR